MNNNIKYTSSEGSIPSLANISTLIIDEDSFSLSLLKECSALKSLHIKNTNREEINLKDIENALNLKNIFITDNKKLTKIIFPSVPNTILNTLNIVSNALHFIPQNLQYFHNLEYLSLEQNKIQGSISEIVNLPIKKLSLYSNQLTDIDPKIFSNSTLRDINLSGNKIKKIDYQDETKISNLEHLSLGDNELVFFDFSPLSTKVKNLNLAINNLTKIPGCIKHFKLLKKLSIGSNYSITHIPSWFSNPLLKIEEIHLGGLSNINFNTINGQLKDIVLLTASGSNLVEFPSGLLEMTNLKELTLNTNQIKYIPPKIIQLKQLEYISIMNNDLEDIPEVLYNMESLEGINLKYNEFSDATKKVIAARFEAKGIEYDL